MARTTRRAALAATTTLVVALLAGCSLTPGPSEQASGSPSSQAAPDEASPAVPTPAPTPQPTPQGSAPSLLVHASVSSGAVVIEVVDPLGRPDAGSPPDGDTGTVLTVVVEDPQTPVVLDVPEAVGGSVQVAPDRTVGVLREDGRLALGLAAPKAEGTDGTQARVRWTDAEAGASDGAEGTGTGTGTEDTGSTSPALVLDVSAVDPAVFPVVVTTHLGTSVVASASWGDREGGRSLAVTPTDWGRVSGATGSATAWADLLAVEPAADTPGMQTQLQCHLIGARDKATWNLEPWRPDLGLVEYALARCNPT
jgi:hypothetical protein